MYKYIASLLIITLQLITARPIYGADPFVLCTIPKSGSHLVIKTLYFITGCTPEWHSKPPTIDLLQENGKFPYTHICLPLELENYYANSPSIKQIIGVRDLRDVCVSIVHQIKKGTWPEFTGNKKKQKKFRKLSFDEQLLWVINQEYELTPSIHLQLGIAKVAEQASTYVQNQDAFVCRFEDLVGQQGGGSDEKQRTTIRQLAEYISVDLNPHEIQTIADHVYGNEINPFGEGAFQRYQSTFREGKIGGWKTHFKKCHKQAFKKRLGNALIALGYEENNDW